MANVAFIGLGVMGYPMAGHLQRAGHQVTVYNRTAEKAARWVQEYGGRFADTPASAARGQDFVLLCVGNDVTPSGRVAQGRCIAYLEMNASGDGCHNSRERQPKRQALCQV